MSKTILQIIPELQTGGAERTVLEVSQAIINSGGKAIVFTNGGRMEAELLAMGGVVIHGEAKSKNPYVILKTNVDKLVAIIKENKVDIVHARSRAPAISAYLAAKKCNIPFVTTYHGIYKANNPIKRFYNGIMTKGDIVIANSEFTKAYLLAEHKTEPEKVRVIYRGVDLSRFATETITEETKKKLLAAWNVAPNQTLPLVLLPARITAWKGQETLIEAANILKHKNIPAHFIFAGDAQGRNDFVAKLQSKITQYGLQEYVHLVGHCDDIPAAMAVCDIVTTPSIEPEAFGRTAAEAQAMARPVIASNHGGAREVVVHGETGFLIEPSNAKDLSQWLEYLIKMGAEGRREIGKAGQRRVLALFTTASLQAKTLQIYDELIIDSRRAFPKKC
jgi:glycosyltransferase involved in cell wall biosynthesis